MERGYIFVFFPLSIKAKIMDDQKIIELLRCKNQDKAFLKLYKSYPVIEKLIQSKGGSKEDAKTEVPLWFTTKELHSYPTVHEKHTL